MAFLPPPRPHLRQLPISFSRLSTVKVAIFLAPSMGISNPSTPLPSAESGSAPVRASGRRVDGQIHVIVGPMFAGKTTALLRRVKSELTSGRNVAIIKSSKDTRYATDSVVTHDGMKFPCWVLSDLSLFKQEFGDDAYEKLDVIGIDEAQFFEDLYDFCSTIADRDRKTVIVAGLDGDYLRRSFGSVLDVIPLADTVTKLTARCELCGGKAFFTLRKTQETRTELIGGADIYMPVCRQHYVNGQSDAEAAGILMKSRLRTDFFLEAAASEV